MRTKNFFQMAALMLGLTITSVMITSCTFEDNPVSIGGEDIDGAIPSAGQGQKQEGYWAYSDYGTYAIINAYTGADKTTLKTLNFPDKLGGKAVMGISWNFHFSEFTSLQTLNFFTDAEIDEMPFVNGCSKLAHINTMIANGTISKADALPSSIKTIPGNCFRGTAIEKIDLSEVTTVDGSNIFSDCNSLSNVKLGKNLSHIEDRAFANIPNKCKIDSPDSLKNWTVYKIASSPNLYVSCTDGAIGWCGDPGSSVQSALYWTMDKQGNLTIACSYDGWFNFADRQIIKTYTWNDYAAVKSITLSEVYALGRNEFKGLTGVTSVTLNDGLTSIGASAFEGCTSLTSITIPASVTSIGDDAFKGCTNLTTITVAGNPTIADGAFPSGATVEYAN